MWNMVKMIDSEPSLLLYMVSSSLHFTVFQSLIYEKFCIQNGIANPPLNTSALEYCSNSSLVDADVQLQSDANRLFLESSVAITLPSLLVCLVIGVLSDSWSRRLSIVIPFVGLLGSDVNYILQSVNLHWNPYWLLLSDLTFAICGGYSGLFAALFSYAAANCETSRRSLKMSLMEASLGLGGTIGFGLSGLALKQVGYATVYGIITALHCVALVYIMLRIAYRNRLTLATSGSSSDELNAKDTESVIKGFGYRLTQCVKDMLLTITRYRTNSGRTIVIAALCAFAVSFIVFSGSEDISFYYLKLKLSWGSDLFGYYKGATYGTSCAMVLFGYPIMKLWLKDSTLALLGLVSRLLGCVIVALAFNTAFVFCVPAVYMFSRFAATGLRSVLSKTVDDSEQGRIFGGISFLEGLCTLLASVVFNSLYPASLTFFPALSYVLMAALMTVPIAIVSFILVLQRRIGCDSPRDTLVDDVASD